MISLFEMAPEHSAKVLSSVFMCKKAVPCLIEKMHLSGKLLAGKSYGAAVAGSCISSLLGACLSKRRST